VNNIILVSYLVIAYLATDFHYNLKDVRLERSTREGYESKNASKQETFGATTGERMIR
jgi:hypothetical protein